MKSGESLRRLLPGIWLGLLAALALVVMPAAFRVLGAPTAGSLARAVFAIEAPLSLAFGAVLLIIERRAAFVRHEGAGASQFSAELVLVLGALFCTVAGYYALQPMLESARAGAQGGLSFGQLHAIGTIFFAAKGLLVLALAWKATR